MRFDWSKVQKVMWLNLAFFIATCVLLVESILIGVSNNGHQNQASEISKACSNAKKYSYSQVADEFRLIAIKNPGYLNAALGAKIWSEYRGQVPLVLGPATDTLWGDLHIFYTICNLNN